MTRTEHHRPERRRSLWQSLNVRTLKYGSHASLFTLIVLGVAVLLYAMAVKHNRPIDVTRAQRFTLAEQSRTLVQSLQQPVKVVGFFQLEAPERGRFTDLLKLYVHLSDRLTYELVDPDRHPALAQRYQITAYNTVVVEGYGKSEKMSRLDEEALTNAILKLTRQRQKVVYFMIGHGEPSLADEERKGYSLAKAALEAQNYTVQELMLARQEAVPADAAVVILAGPRTALLAPERDALTAFLERGGHLLLMIDPDTVPELAAFLAQYGLEVGHDMIIEPNALLQLVGADYLMPAVTAYDAEHAIVKGFGTLMTIFPVVRSVQVATELPEGVSAQALAFTSADSWAETDLSTLQQEQRSTFDETSDRKGPISMAAVATLDRTQTKTGMTSTSAAPQPSDHPHGPRARLVVFGDSEFANNNFFTLQGNGDLFLNTVSWLAEEEDLIAIRPREGSGSGPIVLTAAQEPLIFWLPVVLLPLAVLAFGTVVHVRRRWQ